MEPGHLALRHTDRPGDIISRHPGGAKKSFAGGIAISFALSCPGFLRLAGIGFIASSDRNCPRRNRSLDNKTDHKAPYLVLLCSNERRQNRNRRPIRAAILVFLAGAPTGIRTPVLALKGLRPSPLDDGGEPDISLSPSSMGLRRRIYITP